MDHGRPTFSLEELCKKTKFTRKEIQVMYRTFKQECPNGFVEEDTFRKIYSALFPYGNPSLYAHYVFRTFDSHKSGYITFKDFLQCLSTLSRGSLQEKLGWVFCLYDLNGDGRLTRREFSDIASSIYALIPPRRHTASDDGGRAIRDHVDKIFRKMDRNKDGVVTKEEFLETCSNDEVIAKSLVSFDTHL